MGIYAIKLKENEKLDIYADQWVALSPQTREIVSYSPSAKKAYEIALKMGEEDPILTRIPKRFDSYVL